MVSSDVSVINMDNKPKTVYKFDEALALSGFGKYNVLITILCGSMAIGSMLETMGLGFLVPASQCDLNLTLEQKGWVAAIPYIGIVCASQTWGYLADTRGRRKMLMFSVCSGCICSMLCSLSPNIIVFAILKLLSSALSAASNAIIHAYFGELTPKTHSDMMISVLSAIFMGSTAVATGVAWLVLTLDFNIPVDFLGFNYRPWRLLILCYNIPFIFGSIALFKAPESPKFLMSQGKSEEVLKMLQQMYTMNTGKDVSTYPVHDILIDDQDSNIKKSEKKTCFDVVWNQTVPIFKPPLLKYTIILMVITFGVYGCGNASFMWLPDMMDRYYVAIDNGATSGKSFCEIMSVRTHLMPKNATNLINDDSAICDDSFKPGSYPTLLAFYCALTLYNIIVAVSLKWIPKKVFLLGSLGSGAGAMILIYFIQNEYVGWILFFVFFNTAVLVGIISAFAVELFPTQYRAMAVSSILIFGRFGSIIATNTMGLLLEMNCDLNFFLFSAILFLGFILGSFLPYKKKSM